MTRALPEVEADTFELAVSTSHLLHRAQQLAADRFTVLVGENSITLRQFAVLAAIAKAPGLSQAELVRATGIDRSTLADMMPRMERRAWIERTASDTDGRAKAVRLAVLGAATLTAARQHAKAADAAILDALPRAKRRAFLAALEKLSKVSDKAAQRAERDQRKEMRKKARAEAKAQADDERAAARGKSKRKGKRKGRVAVEPAPIAPEPELAKKAKALSEAGPNHKS